MNEHNILGRKLKVCSNKPKTGFNRDGYCRTDETDQGNHLVCSKMNKDFLNFTKSEGNDLTSVVEAGDNWCLCQNRWLQAYNAGKAPEVIKNATNSKIRQKVKDAIILQKGAGRKKKTRKKRGGWSRAKAREEGHVEGDNVYYQCSNRYPPKFIPQDWRYKDGIEISNESASLGNPIAQRFNIIKMNDRENSIGPVLRVEETTTRSSDRRFDIFAETMCNDGFKPVKKNEGKIGAGRKKKTRKKQKKQFLYNPNDPSKSFDVYIDKNPNDTIPIKYTTVKDVEDTIKKLERLYKTKKYPHKRIWQVGMIMKVRLEAMNKYKKTRYPNAKNVYKRFQLSKKYFKFLGERSKKKSFEDRKKMTFNIKMKKTRKGGAKRKRKNKTKKNKSTKKMDKDFKPNLTPRQMFTMGSFGGTYWRPIKSKFFDKELKNQHKKYSFLKDIPDNIMTKPFDKYDVKLNKYKKKVGTTLRFWENKGWMRESHPYGWVQWYCDYYSGKRSADDDRQIKRWLQLAGPNGRFRKWLVTMILKKGGKWNDESISPAIRQTLQHWGYKLTEKDFKNEVESRKKK